jgi:hypothetical protein
MRTSHRSLLILASASAQLLLYCLLAGPPSIPSLFS